MTATDPTSSPSSIPALLEPDAVPVGRPLEWPVVDRDGTLLFERGAILVNAAERRFMFGHFTPRRGDIGTPALAPDALATMQDASSATASTRDMHLNVGAMMGVRPQTGGSGAPMQPCRLIGFAPNDALFVTLPYVDGRPLPLLQGEAVDVVTVASQAVFRFVCTVEAICETPFGYLVLSKPGAIRRLRERKSIRVHTRFAVRYGIGETGGGYDGIALAKGVSTFGMSLSAAWTLGAVGDRLRIAFRLRSNGLDMNIETSAAIRNIGTDPGDDGTVMHGLELDRLTSAGQMAMKVYVFDHRDDVMYWSRATK